MKKIIEIKNEDWVKGISAHNNIALGGLFQGLTGIDPFEQGGLALPSLTPANKTLGTTPKTLEGFQSSSVAYIYAQSDTKLYQVLKDSPYTVTDVTSEVFQHFTFGNIQKHLGKISWKNRYIYASNTDTGNNYISANTFPVASGSDVLIKDGIGASYDYVTFCVGADNNCYYNYGQGVFGELTVVDNTVGNSVTFKIDDQYHVRALVNDGRFLVILADNNAQNIADRISGAFKCRVYFWDMVQTDGNNYIVPDATFEYNDSYIIGARLLDGNVHIIGSGGVYVTNVATQPKMIRPFPVTASSKMGVPLNGYQMTANKGSLYWVDGFHNTFHNIHAYGNPITGLQKIFYNPYIQNIGDFLITCIVSAGNQIIIGCDQPGLFIFNVGSTRGSGAITTIDYDLLTPTTYLGTKVVLSAFLTSGQSVQCTVSTQNGAGTVSNEMLSYDSNSPKQSYFFSRIPSATNQLSTVEDLNITLSTVGCAVQRISVYGEPVDDITNI